MGQSLTRAHHIVAYDYGIKRNILRLFAEHDCRVTVVPAQTSAEAALELEPDGVFLSNGPGDPDAVTTRRPPCARSPTAVCRSSVSAWAIRSWDSRTARTRRRCRTGIAAEIIR